MIIFEKFDEDGEYFGIIGSRHPDLIKRNALFLSGEVLLQTFPIHPFILLIEVDFIQLTRNIHLLCISLLDILLKPLHLHTP